MSIATRCPHCQTVFRLVPDQLRLRSGLVRCGHCHGVFDGEAERYELPAPAAEAEAATEVTHNYSLSPAWDPWSARSEARVEPSFADADADAAPAAAGATASAPPFTATAPADNVANGPAAPVEDSFPVKLEPRRDARGARLAWRILGSLLGLALLVLLLGQLAWWQRDRIMLRWPASQHLYAQACTLTGCTVAPLRVIEGLQIESTQLQRVDNSPGQLELKMVLHNITDNTVAYPAIELTLLDDKNAVAIRRVIWPQNYLPAAIAAASGLPPQGRQLLLMKLNTGQVAAVNYRIIIFYP